MKFKSNDLVLSGDGRCDSPGKSAKFCTFSMMETTHNQILHFENLDKCEIGLQSPNMEREGMVHCLNFLISGGMKITEVVTDSSTSVAKTLGIYVVNGYGLICGQVWKNWSCPCKQDWFFTTDKSYIHEYSIGFAVEVNHK